MYAPIVLFVYNRPLHTRQTVEALLRNDMAADSILHIFADGPKNHASLSSDDNISQVRDYVHSIKGFKEIHIHEAIDNKGLANSIIEGVDSVIMNYDKVIVLEDDIVTHPFFLRFMNEALDFYKSDNSVFGISSTMEYFKMPILYNKDVFSTFRAGSWGWATWIDRWETINWNTDTYDIFNNQKSISHKLVKRLCRGGNDLWSMLLAQHEGKIDSWAIRLQYNIALQNKLFIRPSRSLAINIGMDGTGIHCTKDNIPLLPNYNKEQYDISLCHTKPYSFINSLINHRIKKTFGGGLINELKFQLKKLK